MKGSYNDEERPQADASLHRPDATDEFDPSILHRSPEERAARGITDDEVRETFYAVCTNGSAAEKDLTGVTLPSLSLDRLTIEGIDRHPVDLSGATIAELSLEGSRVTLPFILDDATIGAMNLTEAVIEAGFSCSNATITGPVRCFEARFEDDVRFDGATFTEKVDFDEVTFRDDVRFDDATFEDDVTFRAAVCYGDSNHLDDNTTFTGTRFRSAVSFRETEFGFTKFAEATFEATAAFQEATFTGDVTFERVTFDAEADFDEGRFHGDTAFESAEFDGPAQFRGASFTGRARSLADDVSFEGAAFASDASFRQASFRGGNFTGATFGDTADFQASEFVDDAIFDAVAFEGAADFDEARFRDDAAFEGATFDGLAEFRGFEVEGGANHLKDDLSFDEAAFATDVDFRNAEISSVSFERTTFGGRVNCRDSVVAERLDMSASGRDSDVYVDFTRAKIRSGRITQPPEGWIRFDLTLASIGDLDFAAARPDDRRQLLDYVRFCRTEFDEFDGHTFDFSGHREYLDRSGWCIHDFDEPTDDVEYALEMDPEVVETTYLKAKQSAQAVGDTKVAGEFRVKRQAYNRRKCATVVTDATTSLTARAKNLGRVVENAFLGLTCGYGMRPMRIGITFLTAPLLLALPYAFGGDLFETTADPVSIDGLLAGDGFAALFETVYFSYISYTTIGYGDVQPVGPLARLLAGSSAYLSTILAALLIYALVKRSEL